MLRCLLGRVLVEWLATLFLGGKTRAGHRSPPIVLLVLLWRGTIGGIGRLWPAVSFLLAVARIETLSSTSSSRDIGRN
jgi:hypothetical protein